MMLANTPLPETLQQHLTKLQGQAGFVAENLKTGQTLVWQDRRFLAASTIKLPILAVYLAAHEKGQLPSKPYQLKRADLIEDSPALETQPEGTLFSWDELAKVMMTVSDNTATNLIIEQLGLPTIQNWIEQQGFKHTHLQRYMMDLEARARGIDNWTSPSDMALFMKKLIYNHFSEPSPQGCQSLLDILYQLEDLEKIPFYFRHPIKVANKPGELPGTRSDVGFVHDSEHQVVMALFTDNLVHDELSDLWLAELAQLLWQELTIS